MMSIREARDQDTRVQCCCIIFDFFAIKQVSIESHSEKVGYHMKADTSLLQGRIATKFQQWEMEKANFVGYKTKLAIRLKKIRNFTLIVTINTN